MRRPPKGAPRPMRIVRARRARLRGLSLGSGRVRLFRIGGLSGRLGLLRKMPWHQATHAAARRERLALEGAPLHRVRE